jgi:hypothetical protein
LTQSTLESNEPTKRIVLVIGNMYEFNTRYNYSLSPESLRIRRENKENFAISAEMALFWGGTIDTRVVVLPVQPDPSFVSDVGKYLGVTIKCLNPALVTGWICRDLLMDRHTLDELLLYLIPYEVLVMPWGATYDYYRLLSFLVENGIKVVDSNCPPIESYWAVNYCDSKLGSRSIIEQMRSHFPDFGAPSGYVCHSPSEAVSVAEILSLEQGEPVILKSDIGSGGKGVKLYSPRQGQKSTYISASDLLSSINNDELWQNVHILVESAIGGGVDLSTPSFDGFIRFDGGISTMGIENMLTNEHQCVGVEMGPNVIPLHVYERIERIGTAIGEHIAHLGFRGWYDVDFLLPISGSELYASEINARRGGATSPIEISQRLFGPMWNETAYMKSFERLWLNRKLNGYDELKFIIDAINNQLDLQSAGIIPLYSNSVILQKPYIGYVIYGKSRDEAIAIESELYGRLPVLSTLA